MGFPIGHRSGVKIPGSHQAGVRNAPRHLGVPIYKLVNPNDQNISYFKESDTWLRFSLRGKLTVTGGQYESKALKASALFRFLLTAHTTGGEEERVIPDISRQMHGGTVFYFWTEQRILGTHKQMVGNIWFVFDQELINNKLWAQTQITFGQYGLLNTGALVGQILFAFTNSGKLLGSISASTTLQFSLAGDLKNGIVMGYISGQATITFSQQAGLTARGKLSAQAQITFSENAVLSGTGQLSAQSQITFSLEALAKAFGRMTGQEIWIDFLTLGTMQQPTALMNFAASGMSDTTMLMRWGLGMAGMDSIYFEKSLNGVDFSEFWSVGGDQTETTASGLDANTNYYLRARGYKDGAYTDYTDIINDWTGWRIRFDGKGTGRGLFRLGITSPVYVKTDGDVFMYAGTTGGDALTEYWFTNLSYNRYVGVDNTKTGSLLVMHKGNVSGWGECHTSFTSYTNGYSQTSSIMPALNLGLSTLPDTLIDLAVSSQYGGTIYGSPSDLPTSLKYMQLGNFTTMSGLTGNFYGMPDLIWLYINGIIQWAGDINDLSRSLEKIQTTGASGMVGDVANMPPNMNYFYWQTNNTLYGDVGDMPSTLVTLSIAGSNVISGSVSGFNKMPNLSSLTVAGYNTISGDLSLMPDWIPTITITGRNEISGSIAGMPSETTYFFITGYNTIGGDLADVDWENSHVSYFYIAGSSGTTITGDIGELGRSSTVRDFQIASNNHFLYGDISELPSQLKTIAINTPSTAGGDIGTLKEGLTLFIANSSNATGFYGSIEDLPSTLTNFSLYSTNVLGNLIDGSIDRAPSGLRTFIAYGGNTISGSVSGIPRNCNIFFLGGYNTLDGDIAGMSTLISPSQYKIFGNNTVYGDLKDAKSVGYDFGIGGDYCRINAYSSSHSWYSLYTSFQVTPGTGYGLPSADVDRLINDLDTYSAYSSSWRTYDLRGSNQCRTSASNTAIANLYADHKNVLTNASGV